MLKRMVCPFCLANEKLGMIEIAIIYSQAIGNGKVKKSKSVTFAGLRWNRRASIILVPQYRPKPKKRTPFEWTMNSQSLRPSVNDLIFRVYGRPLHPELFDIFSVRRIHRADYRLVIYITRSGHVITWDSPEVCLTEVATTVDHCLPEKRQLWHRRMRGEQTGKIECVDNICYQTSFQIESMQPEVFVHTHDELLVEGAKRGMLHNFQPNLRVSLAPLSLISVETRQNYSSIAAFHTFPGENTVVKSQTLIEKKY